MKALDQLERDLAEILNKHGVDAATKTPDYILAAYVVTCMAGFKQAKVAQIAHEMGAGK